MPTRTRFASVALGGWLLCPLLVTAAPPATQAAPAGPQVVPAVASTATQTVAASPAQAAQAQPVKQAAQPGDLYAALPSTTQALLAFEDVRAWVAEVRRSQAVWHTTAPGKAHLKRGGLVPALERWLAALGGNGPAPLALVLYLEGGEPTVQLMMRAEPAALPRLSQLSAEVPLSVVVTSPSTIALTAGDAKLDGRLGADGWLRIGPSGGTLAPPPMSLGALPGRVGQRVQGHAVTAWVDLAGPLGHLMRKEASPSAQEMVGGLRALGMSVDVNAGEWEVDAVVDHGALAMFQSAARRDDLANHFLPMWGADATVMASLSLPPVLFQQAAEGVAEDLDVLPGGVSTREFAALIAQLDGRIGYAGFQSPGDWALAMRTGSGAHSKQLLSALQAFIEAAADMGEVKAKEFLNWEAGGFHLRPDPALHGLVGFARGADLVFATDTRRVASLRSADGAKASGGADHTRYWKPRVKALMERPAMLLVYMLYPDAHDLFAMMTWAMGAARVAWGTVRPPDAAFLDGIIDNLALDYAAAAVQSDMLYDFALRFDLEGGLLVLQTASSEL